MSKYKNFQEYITDNFIHYNGRESNDFESDYNDMLDECHDEIRIGSITLSPSRVLKECDPIAYDIGLDEYIDNQVSDGNWIEEDGNYYSPEEHQRATDDWDDSNNDDSLDDDEDETVFQYRLVREGNLK